MSSTGASTREPSRRARNRPPRWAMYSVLVSPGRVVTKIGSARSAILVTVIRAPDRSGLAGAVVAGAVAAGGVAASAVVESAVVAGSVVAGALVAAVVAGAVPATV